MDADPQIEQEVNGIAPPDWKVHPIIEARLRGKPYYPRQFLKVMQLVLHNHKLRLAIYHIRKKYNLPVDLQYPDERAGPNNQMKLDGDKDFAIDVGKMLAVDEPAFSPVFGVQIKTWALWGLWSRSYHPRPHDEADKDNTYEGGYVAAIKKDKHGRKYLDVKIYNQLSRTELNGLRQFIKDRMMELPPMPYTKADIVLTSKIADLDRLFRSLPGYRKSGKNQVIAETYNKKYKPDSKALINEYDVGQILKNAKKLHL